KNEVNIIIGKNGTGKTTFMNILQAVLVVDMDGIINNDFKNVEITLISKGKKSTVKARKIETSNSPIPTVEYQISNKKYYIKLIATDERRTSLTFRRHMQEQISDVKAALSELVSVSSLSVYRLRNDDEYEVRDRHGSRVLSPVDY